MADPEFRKGFLKGLGAEIGELLVTVATTFGLLKWTQKTGNGNDPKKEFSKALAEIALHKDEDERARVMDDFATYGCENLLAAQTDRQFGVPRPYKIQKGKIVAGKGIPYESGSESTMVNVFVVMRRAFHPNDYEPKEIMDPDTKQKIPNPRYVSAEEESRLEKAYVERLKEMNELKRYKLDARIEFIHDDKAKQFWDRMVEDAKRALHKIPFDALATHTSTFRKKLENMKGARR
jgi:hypothetical protein